VLFSLYSGIVL